MVDLEPISFKGMPDVEMALDAAAYLWTLEFAQVKAQTDAEGLTKVRTHTRLERRASYYEWNIGFIMCVTRVAFAPSLYSLPCSPFFVFAFLVLCLLFYPMWSAPVSTPVQHS
jgi:4-hydroxybenzoate polyprenyltransferase